MAEEPDPLRAELRALQARAYGPRADIDTDPAALARLVELEQASAPRRAARSDDAGTIGDDAGSARHDAGGVRDAGSAVLTNAGGEGEAAAAPDGARSTGFGTALHTEPDGHGGDTARRRARRWGLAGTAVGLAALIAVAAAVSSPPPQAPADVAGATPRVEINGTEAASRMSAYLQYLEGKRNEVLELPGAEAVAARIVRSDFRPYGTLYGRLVGTGRTVDDRVCMIVEDAPAARVVCLSTPWAWPVTVVFPLADSAAFSRGVPAYIGYTLSADGTVVATPGIDPSEVSAPSPERTTVPAPGTQ